MYQSQKKKKIIIIPFFVRCVTGVVVSYLNIPTFYATGFSVEPLILMLTSKSCLPVWKEGETFRR